MNKTPDLEAPVLLMAMPQVTDPFFHRSVVLLIDHTTEASFGFIVNRPTEHRITKILHGLKISWQGNPDALAYFGGPVQTQIGNVLYPTGSSVQPSTATEIYPGLSLTRHVGDLQELAANPPEGKLRLYLGYAGWGEGQLVNEILRNDWLTAPVGDEFVFAQEPEEVWDQALQSVGVDPSTLPTWTPDGEGTAN